MTQERSKTADNIFLLALAARIFVFLWLVIPFGAEGVLMLGDSHQYLRLAEGLLNTGTLTDPNLPGLIEGTRPPGYPLYLAFFVSSGIPLWAASLFQLLLASFIPVLAFMLAERFGFSRRAALLAGVVTALEPLEVLYSVTLLSDAFGALFFLSGVYLLARYWENLRFSYLLASAAILGAVNYIRPIGIYLFIFMPLALIAAAWFIRRALMKRVLVHAMIFAAVFYLMLVPWNWRNYHYFGRFDFLSAVGRHLYDYSAAAVSAAAENTTFETMRQRLRAEILPVLPEPRDIRQFANQDILRARAAEIIKTHPKEYAKLYFFSLQTFLASGNYHYLAAFYGLIDRPSGGNQSFTVLFASKSFSESLAAVKKFVSEPYGVVALLGRIGWGIVFLVSLLGAYWAWRHHPAARFGVVVYGALLVYIAAVTLTLVTGVEARHRLFLNPFYFIFASYAFFRFFRNAAKTENS